MTKPKPIKAWACYGSHGGIFAVAGGGGPLSRYEHMMWVFAKQVTPDLVPVLITPIQPKTRSRKK